MLSPHVYNSGRKPNIFLQTMTTIRDVNLVTHLDAKHLTNKINKHRECFLAIYLLSLNVTTQTFLRDELPDKPGKIM